MTEVCMEKNLDGILLVNKPQGLSSNAVLQKIKRLVNVKKAGHTGSLDPLATGMLPICLGQGTKVCQYLLDADKVYRATGILGIKTDTADATGKIVAESQVVDISQETLLTVLQSFIGETKQTPSMYSALKHQGVPLYKLARKGKVIERSPRTIYVKAIKLLDFDGKFFEIEVSCSKGTYIRNLIEDIGEQLKVFAHMTQLHRLHTAGFAHKPMFSLEQLQSLSLQQINDIVLPITDAIAHFEEILLQQEDVLALQKGQRIHILPRRNPGLYRAYFQEKFIGIVEQQEEGFLQVKRLMAY